MYFMGTAIILLILIVICIFTVKSYTKKLRNGCCGAGADSEKKVKPLDGDKSHYSYEYTLDIEGMTCNNCAAHIKNAFNRQEGFLAEVNLRKKSVKVLTKEPKEEAEFCRIITRVGYELVGVSTPQKIG